MNEYPTHLLCYGKGADMVFSSTSSPQYPGTPFTSQNQPERDVLIAGGFPNTFPDSPFPLSPTLQLNSDLAHFSETELAAIGRAELVRSNSQSFRSSLVEPDSRVAVLGTDAKSLNAFLDRYSGVLQIVPLLVQGSDPDLTTIENLQIVSQEKGCQLSFMVRQPIDLDKCTYCGACGPACPEHCLSEQLFLDFTRCTLCSECVSACPHEAIDLQSREKRELQIPAVLLLKGTKIDLPGQTDAIYFEDELGRLFDSIFTAQIEEVVSCNRSICQYSGRLQTGCQRCLDACPANAVSATSDGIVIDQQKCTECGRCIASCPTGALQYLRFDDRTFIDYFAAVNLPAGGTVVLGDESQLHKFWWSDTRRYDDTFFGEYPQVQALTSMHYLFLLARGVARIIILVPDPLNKEQQDQVAAVNTIVAGLFDRAEPVFATQAPELDALLAQKSGTPLTQPMRGGAFTSRRETLIFTLHYLQKSSGRNIELKGTPFAAFGHIECDISKCTLCLACLNECRVQALQSDKKTWSLNHRTLSCVQCGTCVHVCPENALQRVHGISLNQEAFQSRRLARAEPMTCKGCNKIFGTRQSFERVMVTLRQRETEDNLKLYEYCDTCRVVQIYEAGQS